MRPFQRRMTCGLDPVLDLDCESVFFQVIAMFYDFVGVSCSVFRFLFFLVKYFNVRPAFSLLLVICCAFLLDWIVHTVSGNVFVTDLSLRLWWSVCGCD